MRHQIRKLVPVCPALFGLQYCSGIRSKYRSGSRWQLVKEWWVFTAVEKESAVLQLPASIEEIIPVYSNMGKFTHKANPSYTSVLRHLKRFRSAGGVGSQDLGEKKVSNNLIILTMDLGS